MPRTGLRQRPDCGRHRVFTGPRAAISIRGESKPGADHDIQPQDAGVSRFIRIVGIRNGTIRHVAPFVRGFERESLHRGSDTAEARKQTGPEVYLHRFCSDAGGDQEQVTIKTSGIPFLAALHKKSLLSKSSPPQLRRGKLSEARLGWCWSIE